MSQQFLIVNPVTNNKQSSVSQSNLSNFNQFQIDSNNQLLKPCILNNSDDNSANFQVKYIPVVTNNQLLTNLGQNQVHVSSKNSQINSPLLVVGINNQISLKDQIRSANSATMSIPHFMDTDGNSKLSTINGHISSNSPLIEHHELIPVNSDSTEITFINELDSDNSILSDPGKDDLMISDNEAVLINRNVKVESEGNSFFIKEGTPFTGNASVELVEDYASFVEDAIKSEHSDEESVTDITEEREEFIEMKDDNFYDLELKDPLQTEETSIIEKDIKDPLESEPPDITDKDLKDPLGTDEPVKDPLETVDSDFIETDPLHSDEPIITVSNNSITGLNYPKKRKETVVKAKNKQVAEENDNVQFVRVKNTDPPLYRRVICNYLATPRVAGAPQQDKSYSQKGSGQGNSSVHYIRVMRTNPPLYRKVICTNDELLLKRKQIQNMVNPNQPITSPVNNAAATASILASRLNGHSLSNVPINSTALNTVANPPTILAPTINGQSRSLLSTNSRATNAVPATSILSSGIYRQRGINLPNTSAAINAVPATNSILRNNSQRGINLPITSAALNTVAKSPTILAPRSQSRSLLSINSQGTAPPPQLKLVNSNNQEVNMTPASSQLANNTSGVEVPGPGDYRFYFVRVPESNPPSFRRAVGNFTEPAKSPIATSVNNSQSTSSVPFIPNMLAKNPGVISNHISGVQNINSQPTPTTTLTVKNPGASSIPIASAQNIQFMPTPVTNSTGSKGNSLLRLPKKPKDLELQYVQHQYIKIRDNPPLYQKVLLVDRDQNTPTRKKK